jgi:transcriptional regulator with XRE-family HTH domain
VTLMTDRSLFETTHSAATTPAVAPPSTVKQCLMGTLLAGSVFTGTLSAVTPVDALALTSAATSGRTLPAAPTPAVPAVSHSAAEILNRLRRVSGLSWGDIASAVGVSRRAVHLWLNGGRVAGAHMTRLLALQRLVAAYETGDPRQTRTRLLQADASGRSALDNFRLQTQDARRPTRVSSGTVADLLAPDEHAVQHPNRHASRSSSLRGGAIPRRGPATA